MVQYMVRYSNDVCFKNYISLNFSATITIFTPKLLHLTPNFMILNSHISPNNHLTNTCSIFTENIVLVTGHFFDKVPFTTGPEL